MRCLFILLLVLVAGATGAAALSPPWVEVSNAVRAALAADVHVETSTEEYPNKLQVSVAVAPCCTTPTGRRLMGTAACIRNCTDATRKAQALSTLLSIGVAQASAGFSKKVTVKVTQGNAVVKPGGAPPTNVRAGIQLTRAMLGNSYFVSIINNSLMPGGAVEPVAVFKPAVAQYWADNIGQVGGVNSVMVADLMTLVFDLSAYNLGVSQALCTGKANSCLLPVPPSA